ncbi:chaperonin 10-like protein [Paraphoma chrysanthemicola]|uniref:Chaperonin 10-like protein n=1 Tax=Paraphoma chrysanthemicola TaxID=798071 RepID=A0A8K0R6Z2_9PLEO|nr:chaperonin 10-like protein [Paraphoma chrysanthemicola]
MMKALVTNNNIIARIANASLGKSFGSNSAQWKDVPIPSISDNEILVKVRAVALNPTDFKHIDVVSPPGSIVGCDYAGEVFKVGNNASKTWNIGDRVAGAVHGGLFPDRGAFAEYLRIDSDLAWKVPDDMDDAAATTYGVSAITAMQALNARFGLPWLDERTEQASGEAPTILVYAASTSAGLFTTQLAKAIGCKVVGTASPHSFDLVKSYGADAVFNYRDNDVAKQISKAYPDINKAVDCISEGKSAEVCDNVIGTKGGKVLTLLPTSKPKVQNVEHDMVLAYTLMGHAFQWLPPVGPKFAAIPSDREALARFYANLPNFTKTLKPLPVTLEAGGMDGILPGLDKLRNGKVSGGKLVVKF